MTDHEGGIATNDGRLSKPIDVIPNHNKLLELDSAKVSKWYRFLDQLYTMGMKLKDVFIFKDTVFPIRTMPKLCKSKNI